MLVYRIVLAKYGRVLAASGKAARWNSNEIRVIYASSSKSLACLENVVHRSKLGLSANFSVLTIEIPDFIRITTVKESSLPKDWQQFACMHLSQEIGDRWVAENEFPVMQVPSAIIPGEFNYLINPAHPDFSLIKLLKTEPFLFDDRIKD